LTLDVPESGETTGSAQPLSHARGPGTQLGRLYHERLADYFFDQGQVSFQWEQTFCTN